MDTRVGEGAEAGLGFGGMVESTVARAAEEG
jgi:hypothetical protein